MSAPTEFASLPPPDVIAGQIMALQEELKALRRLLRMSRATAAAVAARQQRESLRTPREGGDHAA